MGTEGFERPTPSVQGTNKHAFILAEKPGEYGTFYNYKPENP
jgi:hypothetical protein